MSVTELRSLVEAAQRGDPDAFGEIVTRFQDMAYASAYAIVGDADRACDATQEAFLDAYCNLTALRDPAAFPGWFRRIVLGRSHRQLRQRVVRTIPLEDAGALFADAPTPAAALDQALLRHDVHAALRALPPGQREATVLYYMVGYSQREIADYLDLSLTAVKKRLFDARQSLKERMAHMVQETLQQQKPSQDEQFAHTVQFFTALLAGDRERAALLAGDRERAAQLADRDPDVLAAQTQWKMALKDHYWPLGFTPLHLTVGRGDHDMTAFLLERNADVNATTGMEMTPLHIAAIMRRPHLAQRLLDRGADVNAQSQAGQTPLHHAAQRNDNETARVLLEHGADVSITDREGLTAADWAALHNNTTLLELLTAHGAPASTVAPRRVLYPAPPHAPILETGIKAVDLLAPLPRGGTVGVFTPLSGVGFIVLLGQLMRAVGDGYDGRAVCLGLETFPSYGDSLQIFWRELGVDDLATYFFARTTDNAVTQREVVAQGVAAAKELRRAGHEVLLLVDSNLARAEGVWSALQPSANPTAGPAITRLVYGHHTLGVEPAPLEQVDAAITFDVTLARQRLYPAIDPVRSRAALLENRLRDSDHAETAQRVRRLLQRYGDLHPVVESGGIEALWYIDDDPHVLTDVARARRLQRFLAQPFYGTEPWTGLIGRRVLLAETIRGCREILNGTHDELPEEAFHFVGTIDDAVAKAARM